VQPPTGDGLDRVDRHHRGTAHAGDKDRFEAP